MSGDQIWVLAEFRRGNLTRATSQLLGGAGKLAAEKSLALVAVLAGGTEAEAGQLAAEAGQVLWLQGEHLAPYEAGSQLAALSGLAESQGRPAAVLAPASACGQELLPRLAARLEAGFAASCVDLWWEGDQLALRRPVHGGKVYEELAFTGAPAVATVRPGAFTVADKLPQPGEIKMIPVAPPEAAAVQVTGRSSTTSGGLELTEARVVVAGGRGFGSPESFAQLEQLASALGAAVGASRSVVDAQWRTHDEQVGKSGKTISPELYFACGISGAIHHVLGMNTAKVVVAINTDPEAPIFQQADFGLVGDVQQVIPALTSVLEEG